MRVVFLTVADPHIGLGHLYRCDALATALNERGIDTTLAVDCRSGHEWLAARAPETTWTVTPWTENPQEALGAISDIDRVIIDAYEIEPDVRRLLADKVDTPVWFDDYGSNVPARGIVINGSPGAYLVAYPERPGLVLLLGTDYQVLRRPFWQSTDRIVREHVESVGVSLGGTDHRGLASDVLSIVRRTVPSDTTVYAIGAEPDTGLPSGIEATGRLTAREMKNLFDRLDLLITAAGQTVAEAVSCGLPTTIFQTDLNQKYNYLGWNQEKLVLGGGNTQEGTFGHHLVEAVTTLLDSTVRAKLSYRAARKELTGSTRRLVARLCGNLNSAE